MKQFLRECWSVFISDNRYLRCARCGNLYHPKDKAPVNGHVHGQRSDGDAWRRVS